MAKTVLAIDDSASIRQMVAFTLKSSGYDVVEAVDGMDGLDEITVCAETHVTEWTGHELKEHVVTPEDVGLVRSALEVQEREIGPGEGGRRVWK